MSTNNKMLISEFVASFLLGFFGLGMIVQYVVLGGISSMIEFGILLGLAVAIIVIVFNPISGAQFNPGVTLTLALLKGFDKKLVLPFCVAQVSGWCFGTVAVGYVYRNVMADWAAKTGGNPALMFYCNTPSQNLLAGGLVEFTTSALLLMVVFACIDPRIPNRPSAEIFPFAMGAFILFIVCFSGAFTGTCLNLARDLGARLAGVILGVTLGYDITPIFSGGQWIMYIIAPTLGAVFGGYFYEKVIAPLLPKPQPVPDIETVAEPEPEMVHV